MMISIFSHTHNSFSEAVRSRLGRGGVHAGILYQMWFRSGALSHDPAFNNAQVLRQAILEVTDFSLPKVIKEQGDEDTKKFLLETDDSLSIEMVFITTQARGTLCISSQVGCRMGCAFCETGRMGLQRNLSTKEIVSQLFVARFVLKLKFSNVVFMGMGEPFDNYDNVIEALRILRDPRGFAFGSHQITISTSGHVKGIQRLIDESDISVNLAVSVNAPDDTLRRKLMPINRKYDMQSLHDVMHQYCVRTGRQILIAYVLLDGVNASIDHADALANFLRDLNVRVNLIACNPQRHGHFKAPNLSHIEAFKKRLRQHGYQTLLRPSRGQNIMAGCGQLGRVPKIEGYGIIR